MSTFYLRPCPPLTYRTTPMELDVNPKNKPKGNRELFPRYCTSEKVFLFPEFFKHQLKAEWAKPTANRQFLFSIKKLYELPSFANKMLQLGGMPL